MSQQQENQISAAVSTSRNLSQLLDECQLSLHKANSQYELLKAGYIELGRAYHALAHIVQQDRHTTDWSLCQEQTCTEHKKYLNQVEYLGLRNVSSD